MRQAWAEGRLAHKRKSVRGDYWRPEEEARLADLVGTMELFEVAERLAAEFGHRRTVEACRAEGKLTDGTGKHLLVMTRRLSSQ